MSACPRCAAPCSNTHCFCFACGSELEGVPRGPQEDLPSGRTLPGGYRITNLVGVGGMGRVYCAEQVALGRTVAVKVLHPHLADDEIAAARFLNEARAASRLSHRNCVAIFDFGRTEEGRPYIVMEYVRGRDLGQIVDSEGPLPLRRIVDVLCQTLAALEEAHALGIIHRDLKPDNIVLESLRSGADSVKVVDFGLAKILDGAAPPPPHAPSALTRPGLVCGTPEYMSPEQGRGDRLDGRADVYSLAVVLFELLAGRVPFAADTATKTLLLHLDAPPPDPREVAPDRWIPAPFAELALRGLAKSPGARFQSARAFSNALEQALIDVEGTLASDAAGKSMVPCRRCAMPNPPGKKFCGECGASLAASRAPGAASGRSTSLRAAEARARAPTPPAADGTPAFALGLTDREDAMAWLEARRHEAGAMLAAAHIVGDVGMGKTRLLKEFLALCAARGDRVVTVGPDPTWAKPLDTAVRDAICALADLPREGADESAWSGARTAARRGLSLLLGPQPPTALEPDERRRALAEALRWALARASQGARGAMVILAVDDLDFVDGTSRNAFADVLTEPPVTAALLIVTCEPTTQPVGAPLAGETCVLKPLGPATYAHLLPSHMTRDTGPIAPLHVEQLIAWAREGTDVPPGRLADLVARRLERLSAEARHAMYAMAVWGDDATPEALGLLLPSGIDTGAAIDALDCARMVTIDDLCVRIAHPLLRRVTLASIPAGQKRELFGRARELRPGAPLEVRAKQAMHGGGAFEALSLMDELSARRAAAGDVPGSISALRHALEVARRELHQGEMDDPVGTMLVFSRKLAEALALAERWVDAEGVLREALGNAPPASEHRVRLLGVLARVANSRRQTADARRYLDEAMRVARQSDARELLPMLESLEKLIAVA